jgi:hypothetical protein
MLPMLRETVSAGLVAATYRWMTPLSVLARSDGVRSGFQERPL